MSLLDELVPLAEAHQAADEYISGRYDWSPGACAIGCTIRDAVQLGKLPPKTSPANHAALAEATGLPEMVWRLADHIFEGLPANERSAWTPRFLRAAAACPAPDSAPARVMTRLAQRLADDAIRPEVRAASLAAAALWARRARGDEPTADEWDAARQQAYAAWQQADAAQQQAYAAWQQADAAQQQADAAWQQADAAQQQADAAQQQAYAAWQQADAAQQQADAAWQQADAARQQADAAQQQAYAAWQQADAAQQQAYAAWQQAYAARQQADAAWQQAYAARQQADAARQQADAAWQQAYAAWQHFWDWCADVLIEELSCPAA